MSTHIQKRRTKIKDKSWEGYLYISPWLLGFFALTLLPLVQSLYYSFTDYPLLEPGKWVGLKNYHKIFTDDSNFIQTLKVTSMFVFISVPLKLAFALFIAMVLNMKIRLMSIYRTMIYFPSIIGASVAVAIIWSNIFGKDGLVNQILALFHIEGKNWIGFPETALPTLILLVVWQFGSAMVLFLAGLKQIPAEYYEAAAIDGAGKIRTFFKITIPMLSPIILFNLVLQTIGSFQSFTQAFLITKGGPAKSTYMYALYLFEKAFVSFQMGYASALAWIMLLVIGTVTAFIFITSKSWVHYETDGGK